MNPWTPEQTATLRTLYATLSASEIAVTILNGTRVTRHVAR